MRPAGRVLVFSARFSARGAAFGVSASPGVASEARLRLRSRCAARRPFPFPLASAAALAALCRCSLRTLARRSACVSPSYKRGSNQSLEQRTRRRGATRPCHDGVHRTSERAPTRRLDSDIRPGNGPSRHTGGLAAPAVGEAPLAYAAAAHMPNTVSACSQLLRRETGSARQVTHLRQHMLVARQLRQQQRLMHARFARVSTRRPAAGCAVTRAFGHSAHFHGGPVAAGVASLSSLSSSLSEMSSTRAGQAARFRKRSVRRSTPLRRTEPAANAGHRLLRLAVRHFS